jgi:hypothetical protein
VNPQPLDRQTDKHPYAFGSKVPGIHGVYRRLAACEEHFVALTGNSSELAKLRYSRIGRKPIAVHTAGIRSLLSSALPCPWMFGPLRWAVLVE